MCQVFILCVIFLFVQFNDCLKLDYIDCGIDREIEVVVGDVEITRYPWLGVLYYMYKSDGSDTRSVTTVVLIHKEFVLAAAADIGPMPKHNFRRNSRVLLGEPWQGVGRRVRNYVIHPEYGETYNTAALIQLKDVVRNVNIRPVCPPPEILKNPVFYVVKFKEDLTELQKEAIEMTHVPAFLCKEFYVAAKLGFGVRGPGCGAPSRYLDMLSYYPWIEQSLDKFQHFTISKLNKQSFVLRSSSAMQRFGACDEEEKIKLAFRELIVLRTDHNQFQFMTYNISIIQNIEFSCMTLELTNASATSEMKITHICPSNSRGEPCYRFKGSKMELSVAIMFSDTCIFEMYIWGVVKNMTLLDIHEWKWEEGEDYEDFNVYRVDYRGPAYQTGFGFEPVDSKMWVPQYDLWFTTESINMTTESSSSSSTTSVTTTSRTPRTKRTFSRRTRLTRSTTKSK